MKTPKKIALALIGGILTITGVSACYHHRTPEERADYMVDKISDRLDLTPSQQNDLQQLKSILVENRRQMIDQYGAVPEVMLTVIDQPTLNQELLLNQITQRTESINIMAPNVVAALADFYNGLTPAQQEELREKLRDHNARRHHW